MTTTTERIAALTDAQDEAARQMGMHAPGSPVWCAEMAKRNKARDELRQMEEKS